MIAYVIRAFSCVIFAALFSSPLSNKSRSRLTTVAAGSLNKCEELAAVCRENRGLVSVIFLKLCFFFCIRICVKYSGKETDEQAGILYVWQSSRLWCWKVVSLWISRSIPLELFLLFSKSPCLPDCLPACLPACLPSFFSFFLFFKFFY